MMLAVLQAATLGEHRVTLLITEEVRGAVFPTNKWNTECKGSTFNSTPCECYGGAARRNAFLAPARLQHDTVAIDAGSCTPLSAPDACTRDR